MPKMCAESCLPFFAFSYTDPVIGTLKVQFLKYVGSAKPWALVEEDRDF